MSNRAGSRKVAQVAQVAEWDGVQVGSIMLQNCWGSMASLFWGESQRQGINIHMRLGMGDEGGAIWSTMFVRVLGFFGQEDSMRGGN